MTDMPMMNGAIWVHPTDLLDEGPAQACAAIRDMGLATISLAATYHAARFLLPHDPKSTVKLLEDGVAWYRPDPARWEKQRLRPKAAAECADRDLAREARDAAVKAGLTVHAWVVALHNSRLGEAHPDCTLKNAFGDRYTWGLCPSHPDVRSYAATLAEEVAARLEPAALELEAFGFMGYSHQSHHDKAAVKLDGAHDFLLSLCFCDHCGKRMQARRVDSGKLAEKARGLVKEFINNSGPEGRRGSGLEGSRSSAHDGRSAGDHHGRQDPARNGDPVESALRDRPEVIGPWLAQQFGALEFANLLSVRKETVVSLVEEVRRRVPKKVKLFAMAHPSPFVTGAAIGGGLLALNERVDGFVLNLFHADAARIHSEVLSARTAATPTTRFAANLRAFAPDSPSEASFVEKVEAVRAEGLEDLRVYHYGLMPRSHFAWVKKALAR